MWPVRRLTFFANAVHVLAEFEITSNLASSLTLHAYASRLCIYEAGIELIY